MTKISKNLQPLPYMVICISVFSWQRWHLKFRCFFSDKLGK